jgi:hypothetical protein
VGKENEKRSGNPPTHATPRSPYSISGASANRPTHVGTMKHEKQQDQGKPNAPAPRLPQREESTGRWEEGGEKTPPPNHFVRNLQRRFSGPGALTVTTGGVGGGGGGGGRGIKVQVMTPSPSPASRARITMSFWEVRCDVIDPVSPTGVPTAGTAALAQYGARASTWPRPHTQTLPLAAQPRPPPPRRAAGPHHLRLGHHLSRGQL